MVTMKIYQNTKTNELLTHGQFRKRCADYIEQQKANGVTELPTIAEVMLNDDDIQLVGELDVTDLLRR